MTDPATTVRTRTPIIIGAVVLGALALGAAALYGTNASRGNGPAATAGAGGCEGAQSTIARMAPLARGEVAAVTVEDGPKSAPAMTFMGPGGERLTTADLKGKTVLLNLWATWCAPCRQEMPALDRLQMTLGGSDFEVVAVNLDTRNLERPKNWLAENGVRSLAYYADPEGRMLPALQQPGSGNVIGLPTSLIIDPAGCSLAVIKGPADWASDDATRLIRAALGR